MMNFRYHLVSLTAVFLALAVGVVLGAGPLQNAINTQIKTDSNTSSQEQLQAELEEALAVSVQAEVFAQSVGDEVLPGTLEDAKVALVALPGVTQAEADMLSASMQVAGAKVVGTVWVTESMVSPDQSTYRQTLASPISAHLTARPADGEPANVLATGLVEILTTSGAETDLIKEIMADETTPLIEADSFPSEVADTVVLLGPSSVAGADQADGADGDEGVGEDAGEGVGAGVGTGADTDAEQSGAVAPTGSLPPVTRDAWIALANAIEVGVETSVAVGQAASADDLISVLRTNRVAIATVDQGGTQMAALNAALVLADRASGAFGQQEGATRVLAPLP